jgi:tRNA (guanine-N7-)-methyltransferase
MSRVRVHQHVNPLTPHFRFVSEPVDLSRIFSAPANPVHLDIGSARGRFLLAMAEALPETNFLGLEIREALVTEANRIAAERGLKNLYFEFTNATMSLGSLISGIPAGILKTVSIQFPDPWYKKKHAKRRMVNGEMVKALAGRLSGKVFIQTDVQFLAAEIFDLFRQHNSFTEIELSENPFPVKTEREKAVEDKGLPVYRTLFKNQM